MPASRSKSQSECSKNDLKKFAIIAILVGAFLSYYLESDSLFGSFFGGLFVAVAVFFLLIKRKNEKNGRLKAEEDRIKAEIDKAEALRILRDADTQKDPYEYKIGRHANETLALRYGLVNAIGREEMDTIKARKLSKLKQNFYEVELPEFGNRKVIAVIEPGTDYVKTFYPTSDEWFTTHGQLEAKLKNNSGLSLSDIAKYHIDAALK